MTQLAKTEQTFSLTPKNLTEALRFAELIAESDIVPQDYKGKPGNVMIAIQMGLEVGLKPLQALQNIAIINGRPAIWGDAAVALVRNHPEFEYMRETWEDDNQRAVVHIKRKEQPEEVRMFSLSDAQLAKLVNKSGTPWQSYPKRMCAWRAKSWAMRDVFADALKGLSIAEEAQDMHPIDRARDVTPEAKDEPKGDLRSRVADQAAGKPVPDQVGENRTNAEQATQPTEGARTPTPSSGSSAETAKSDEGKPDQAADMFEIDIGGDKRMWSEPDLETHLRDATTEDELFLRADLIRQLPQQDPVIGRLREVYRACLVKIRAAA